MTKTMTTKRALTDIKTLRLQARKHIDAGAVTAGYLAVEESHADELADLLTGLPDSMG